MAPADPFASLISPSMGVKPHSALPSKGAPNSNLPNSAAPNSAAPNSAKPYLAMGDKNMKEREIHVIISVRFEHIVQQPHPNAGARVQEPLKWAAVKLSVNGNPNSHQTVQLNAVGQFNGNVRLVYDVNRPLKVIAEAQLQNNLLATYAPHAMNGQLVTYTMGDHTANPAGAMVIDYLIRAYVGAAPPNHLLYRMNERCYSFALLSVIGRRAESIGVVYAGELGEPIRVHIAEPLGPRSISLFMERNISAGRHRSFVQIGKSWSSFSIMAHEWGHYTMYTLYFNNWSATGGDHFFCQRGGQLPTLAWSEGYASAFCVILADLEGVDHTATYGFDDPGFFAVLNMETYSCPPAYIPNPYMPTDEGRITAALWDLYDILVENNNGGDTTLGANGFGDTNTAANRVSASEVLVAPLVAVGANTQRSVVEYWASLKPILAAKAHAPNPNPVLDLAINSMCYNYFLPQYPPAPDCAARI